MKAIVKSKDLEKSLRSMISEQQSLISKLELLMNEEGGGNNKAIIDLTLLLISMGIGWGKTGIASSLARGQILFSFKIAWSRLPKELTSQFDDSYDQFVQERFMMSPGQAVDAAEKWDTLMSGKHCKIPKNVDVFALNSGRLSAAVRLAKDGKLSPKKWDVLTSEALSNKQVYGKLFARGKTRSGRAKKRRTQLISSNGDIRVFNKSGEMKIIGYLDYNSSDSEVIAEVQRIIKWADIEIVP